MVSIVFDLVADDGTHHKIDYSVDKPLTRYELANLAHSFSIR